MKKKSKGQAMIEYLLMVVVVVILAVSAYEKLNTYFFEPGGFFARYATGVNKIFSAGNGLNLKYKRFSLKR